MMQSMITILAACQIQSATQMPQNPIEAIAKSGTAVAMQDSSSAVRRGYLEPGESDRYAFTLGSGVWEAVARGFNPFADIDLHAFDANGNLIAKDDDLTNIAILYIRSSGRNLVQFKVSNTGEEGGSYILNIE